MKTEIIPLPDNAITHIISDDVIISTGQDALQLLMDCHYNNNSTKIILKEEYLIPEFFDLKTGIAGDVLQKFSTYKSQLAIVGDFTKYSSKSLESFIIESNKAGRILFTDSFEKAIKLISQNIDR